MDTRFTEVAVVSPLLKVWASITRPLYEHRARKQREADRKCIERIMAERKTKGLIIPIR